MKFMNTTCSTDWRFGVIHGVGICLMTVSGVWLAYLAKDAIEERISKKEAKDFKRGYDAGTAAFAEHYVRAKNNQKS